MLEHSANFAIITDQVDQDLRKACKEIKEQGYHYVELHHVFNKSIEECSEAEGTLIKEILIENELEVINIASTIFFLCPLYEGYHVSSFNDHFHAIEGDFKYHLAMLHNACRIAKQLQCPTIRIFPFRYPDNDEIMEVGTSQDQKVIAENFRKAVAIAKIYDITLVVENCPYSHCPKGEMTYSIIKAVDDDHLKLLWDPANSYRAEIKRVPQAYKKLSLEKEYELIKDEIRHVHLKNYTYDETKKKPFIHQPLLEGDIDYQILLNHMVSYHHFISLEPEINHKATIQAMQDLKRIMEESL